MDMLNVSPIPAASEPPKIDPILGFSPVDETLLDLKLQKLFHRFAVANLRSHIIFRPIDVQPEYRFSYENNFTLFLYNREFNAWLDFQKTGVYNFRKIPEMPSPARTSDLTGVFGGKFAHIYGTPSKVLKGNENVPKAIPGLVPESPTASGVRMIRNEIRGSKSIWAIGHMPKASVPLRSPLVENLSPGEDYVRENSD